MEFFASGFSIHLKFQHLVVPFSTDKDCTPFVTPGNTFAVPALDAGVHEVDASCRNDVAQGVELDGESEEAVLWHVVGNDGVKRVAEPCDAAISARRDVFREGVLRVLHQEDER